MIKQIIDKLSANFSWIQKTENFQLNIEIEELSTITDSCKSQEV